MPRWHSLIAIVVFGVCSIVPAHAQQKEIKQAQDALRVLKQIMMAPDRRLPKDLMRHAHAIAVIPDVLKVGLVFGGRRGEGLISIKTPDNTWSNPSYVTLTGGSFGFQAGVQSTDVILVFRTQRGVDSIVHGKFTLGADASVAAGPVGRDAHAATDAQLKAEIYSYSRSRGLFAGVALSGAVLGIDHDANRAIYGRDSTTHRIFSGQVSDVPNPIVDFRDRLEEYTAH